MRKNIISVMQLLAISLITSSIAFVSCINENKQTITNQTEISFKKEGELSLYKGTSDTLVKILDIEIADNDYETQTGLMHRSSMKETQGMLFIFEDSRPRYFYMKNTHIPLDILYLDETQKIVSTQLNAKPMDETTLPSNADAQYVLEINAGLFDQWNLKIGDSISFKKH